MIETQSKNGQIKDIRELVSMYILDTLCGMKVDFLLHFNTNHFDCRNNDGLQSKLSTGQIRTRIFNKH